MLISKEITIHPTTAGKFLKRFAGISFCFNKKNPAGFKEKS